VTTPATIDYPTEGVWRLGRGPDPLRFRSPEPVSTAHHGAGNRFDSFHGNYGILYAATEARSCFAECLARFRPNPRLADIVRTAWSENGWMSVGSVPADWRNSRVLARVGIDGPLPFVDVTASETVEAFRSAPQISSWLESFGVAEFDLSEIMGRDRRVTRLLSQWVAESVDDEDLPAYGGIRYMSRLGLDYECWAIFQGSQLVELERRSLLNSDEDLCSVARTYGLTVH